MLQDKIYDVIVIGAGAAGLMAAGTVAMNGRKELLMEKWYEVLAEEPR